MTIPSHTVLDRHLYAPVRANDPDTSQEAADGLRVRYSHEQVLVAARRVGAVFTADQLEAALEGEPITPQRVRTAVSELRELGLMERLEFKRTTRHGRPAYLHRLTEEGWRLANTLTEEEEK